MNTIDLVTEKMQGLPPDKQQEILDFVDILMVKYLQEKHKKFSEQRALERLKDEKDPTKWTTIIEEGEEINVESSLENLKKRGYKIQIPN